MIAENMFAQVDDDGHDARILDSILDCRKDSNRVEKSGISLRTKIGK